MSTQLDSARSGITTDLMVAAASAEGAPVETVLDEIRRGRAVLPFNPSHSSMTNPALVGRMFRTKVNANIGRSKEHSDSKGEVGKLDVALEVGADAVMDLSVGPDLAETRKAILSACPVPLGTVPVYEAVSRGGGEAGNLDPDELLRVIGEQAKQGVDFMTLHAGILRSHVGLAARRLTGIVSRGGSIMAAWMVEHGMENPLYERWDEVLDICSAHDVTLSLGDGLRPGCLADASDEAQFAELDVLGALVRRCRERGVQVMVEGPGHVPFDQVKMNIERALRVCDDAPFYVLGPVVTDVAPGYDHITACIGAAAAGSYGAALLCYVTPAEHLGLPTGIEVREGVVAFKIAAHAADVARKISGAREWDDAMARARAAFDWNRQFELAIDPERARARFAEGAVSKDSDHCSMCGPDFCAMRLSKKIAEKLSL